MFTWQMLPVQGRKRPRLILVLVLGCGTRTLGYRGLSVPPPSMFLVYCQGSGGSQMLPVREAASEMHVSPSNPTFGRDLSNAKAGITGFHPRQYLLRIHLVSSPNQIVVPTGPDDQTCTKTAT